ncbi:hypothetical protein shn_32215 (plasmid) [Shinella sp. HZN7]|nr:hypothetical protein shn_32215 [Shinella sp. HZN7]
MFGPNSELAIAHGPDFAAERLLAHRNAKLLPQPLRQIAQTPANDAVEIGCRPTLDGLRQGRTLLIVQPRLWAGSLAIDQTLGTAFVEPHDPVTDNLQRDVTEAGGIGTRASIVDRRQRQQSARLSGILRLPRQPPQTVSIKIRP